MTPVYPAHGSAIPGQPGFVVAECGHRVAATEWRAGFRTCERCPRKPDTVPMTPDELEELRQWGCTRDDIKKLFGELDRLTAELSDWREAASYWEGPEDCLERECEEFFDEDGNDRFEKDHCSHMTAKSLTPEEAAKVISGSLSGGEAE